MRIVAWVREISDTRDLIGEILDAGGRPRWGQWESRFDPEDLNALEMALQLRDSQPESAVAAFSIGGPQKLDVLRESFYRGVDQAFRLSAGDVSLDSLGEARLMAGAVDKLGEVDVLFTGIQLNEGDYGQRGAMVAELLGWPLVSYVDAVESVGGERLTLRRAIEGGIQLVEAPCPVVISVGVALLKDDPRAPRSAKAKLKLKHKKTPIPIWETRELGIQEVGSAAGIRTRGYRPLEQRHFPSRRIDGNSDEELQEMVVALRIKGLLR